MKQSISLKVGKIVTLLLLLLLVSYGATVIPTTNNNLSIASFPLDNQVEKPKEETSVTIDKNNITSLQEQYQNTDIKGLISIENEKFRYPVVQTTNNDFYLTHDYSKKRAALGAIYADYRVDLDTSKKALIFGHSSTKVATPFNNLEKYYDKEYYQKHKYITLETATNTYRYEIFSVYIETSDFTYMNMKFDTPNEWYSHLLKLKGKSMYPIDVKLDYNSDILIMQTCSNHPKYKKYAKKYLLIVSRRIK